MLAQLSFSSGRVLYFVGLLCRVAPKGVLGLLDYSVEWSEWSELTHLVCWVTPLTDHSGAGVRFEVHACFVGLLC